MIPSEVETDINEADRFISNNESETNNNNNESNKIEISLNNNNISSNIALQRKRTIIVIILLWLLATFITYIVLMIKDFDNLNYKGIGLDDGQNAILLYLFMFWYWSISVEVYVLTMILILIYIKIPNYWDKNKNNNNNNSNDIILIKWCSFIGCSIVLLPSSIFQRTYVYSSSYEGNIFTYKGTSILYRNTKSLYPIIALIGDYWLMTAFCTMYIINDTIKYNNKVYIVFIILILLLNLLYNTQIGIILFFGVKFILINIKSLNNYKIE